jgi:uncharacterized protein
MDLSFDRTDNYLFVRRVSARSVTVVDSEFTTSFLLAPDRVVENWPVGASSELNAGHVDAILELKPELVILGTGERQVFPDPAFMAGLLRRGIGIEVMDNGAAARTYDLLAAENRRVVAAFILPA